jgi:GNAT superfamily N-acetyltransferase
LRFEPAVMVESNQKSGRTQMILPDGYSDVPSGKIAAVVTHLEMSVRPTLPSDPPDPPHTWTLRRVEQPDLDWYRELHARVGAEWLWTSRLCMGDAELASIIRADGVDVYALEHEGRDEGLLELDFRESENCEIVFFGVTAKLIGSGAGRFLMTCALQRAWSGDVARVWLHTCTFDSARALGFYQRSGFRPFRMQIEIVNDPRLDGTVPRHAAPHVPMID